MTVTTDEPTVVMPDSDTSSDMMELFAPYQSTDDPNTRTHIVRPRENQHICQGQNLSGQDVVDYGRMHGVEVVALCGYKWVPKHNPENYDACQPCFKVAELIMSKKIR